jgi:hypothetical protein
VHVFDDDDERGRVARPEQHVPKCVQGQLLELGTCQAVEEVRRGGRAKEVGQQDSGFVALHALGSKMFGDAAPDFLAGHTLGESEVAPQQF